MARRSVRVSSTIDLDGPFFTHDPAKTVRGNIRDMLDRLAEEMERDVRHQMEGHAGSMPRWTGWTRDHVMGRTSSLGGRRWGLNLVVSANTTGLSASRALRTMAAAAGIERRFHPFRRTASSVRHASVRLANLAKGLE